MDIAQLCAVLQGCLSSEQAQRTAAEGLLKQNETVSGQAVNLLRVAAEDSVDAAVRQVAAISFKNLVKRSWDSSSSGEGAYQMSPEDQNVVRNNLMESLIRAPHMVQLQLGEVFKTIVYADFPTKWPGLPQAIFPNLMSQDETRLHGGLYTLRILARRFEFKSDDERTPMEPVITEAFPILLHLLKQLMATQVETNRIAEFIKLVFKIFWSCTYMEVPAVLLQPDQFVGWMQCLHSFITRLMPQPSDTTQDVHLSPWWKAKKWALHISHRLFSRYSNAKQSKQGSDSAFSEMYRRDCMTTFLDAYMQLLSTVATGAYISPRALNLVFQFLTHAVEVKVTYNHGKPHWESILMNVAFPVMCFNNEDARLWEEDPHEYIRKGYDIMEDMYSPKTAVSNYAHELCGKKKSHLDSFMMMIVQILNGYQAKVSSGAVTTEDVRRLDGALLAVGMMVDLLKNKSPYKQQLGPMLINCIIPCFKSPWGHLRAKAAWLAGVYSDAEFADGQGLGATFSLLLQNVITCLGDPDLPVRVDSVIAMRHFMDEIRELEPLKPLLPALLTSIFSLMSEVENEDMVYTLEAIVEKFGEDIAPFAVQMTQQLVAAFWKYKTAEENEDEDDDGIAAMAAYGCIKAINTLLSSVSSLSELHLPLEEILFPVMQKMISTEGQDIFEDVLETLAIFTYYNKQGISPRLWSLWPQIHACLLDWAIDYWENVLVPLDNMISRDPETFLNSKNPDYMASVFEMVSTSLKEDFGEREVVPAAKLLGVILQVCRGRVDHCVGPYLQIVLTKLSSATRGSLKDALIGVVANALHYNAPLTLSLLQQQGALQSFLTLWFTMIFTQKKSGKGKHFKLMHDKKVCVLGLVAILTSPDEALPAEVRAGMSQLMAGVMKLLVALKTQQEEVAKLAEEGEEDEEEDEEDWDADALDDEDEDEDGEGGDEDGDAYLKRLERIAAKQGEGDEDEEEEDDDDDDDWTDDEEEETPIDPIDPFVLFSDCLARLQTMLPARHASLMANLDDGGKSALQGILVVAAQEKASQAKRELP
ncbi:hypothetical protein CEUSTIGMA_g2156.t1 [Chlamydomonas eustigma]|uniref:Importin N-terminal domain-containing protein n=1 Tax=Chlamydomonas eustigma TaxID=1157962 RepID=A0A250WV55_9CHLO|nr:hypothetical protein CEUSTIGMA_g2156.t1 [Chlamydomonas eustigma]|eukprot:GAX74708.1 hypothetical protein CEUSTIGMA_g2156.t1 [Chlamydomonas eustigma]